MPEHRNHLNSQSKNTMPNGAEDLSGVMRRIEKLLAIAQDDRANPNEAASAAGMAERIMRKYQIEHSDIIFAALKSKDSLSTGDVVASAKTNGTQVRAVPLWASWLAAAVAKLNDCGARIIRYGAEGNTCVRFYGFHADVTVATWTLEYLVSTVNRLCDSFKETQEYRDGGRKTVNSYRQGVAVGVLGKLKDLQKAKETAGQPIAQGTALVVVKQQAIADKYGDFGFRKAGSSVERGSAFARGRVDGSKVNVSLKPVQGPSDAGLSLAHKKEDAE